MPKITYVEHNGTKHKIELAVGETAMRGALENSIFGIDGDCGGECACGTCHVYVDTEWFGKLGPVSDMEASLLSFSAATQPHSRLACQIAMSNELDGLIVAMPDGQHGNPSRARTYYADHNDRCGAERCLFHSNR